MNKIILAMAFIGLFMIMPIVSAEENINSSILDSVIEGLAEGTNYLTSKFILMVQGSNIEGTNNLGKTFATTEAASGNGVGSTYVATIGYFGISGVVKRTETEFYATITSTGNISAGSIYSATIKLRNASSDYANASSFKVSLYDPLRNLIVSNVDATFLSTGIYQYNFTTASSHTSGEWETVFTIILGGTTKTYSDFWQLENAPTEVTINSISDSTIPTITADVTITNEGSVAYEYPYEYCVVSQQSNQCGGGDDIDYGSGSKLIAAGESWNPSLTLNVNDAGTYWFKVSVTYGAQTAGASKSFEAVSATVGSGGTGGGGGGDSDITARVIVPMYKFDISAEVLENYKIIKPGENIVIEYIMYNLGTEEIKDAIFSYSIKDADENIVISETEEKVAILTELKIVREITLPEDLKEGTYYVNAKLQYSDKIIGAIDSFIVLKKDKIAEEEPEVLNIKIDKSYLIMGGIGLGILILFIFILIIIIRKKRKNRKINDLESKLKHLDELKERNKINKSVYHSEREKLLQSIRNVFKGNAKYIIALLIGIFAYMILINSSHITGYSIEGMILDNIELTGSVLILVIALSLLIFVYRQKIKEFIEKILGYPDNHVRGLIKKKVYVSHGDYIGKIEDVMLGDNKIYGLKIKLDKKKFAGKRILVRWKHVKSCGEIVMIDSNVVKAMGDSDEK